MQTQSSPEPTAQAFSMPKDDISKMSIASIVKTMTPQQQREFAFRTGLADTSKLSKKQLSEIQKDVKLGFLNFLDPAEQAVLRYSWKFWARPNQIVDMDDPSWEVLLALAGRGFGKAICHRTKIPTPSGWTTMGDLKPGDVVFDESGKPCRVTAKFSPEQNEQYRVTFSDGSHIDACADHQWVTWRHKDRKAFLRSVHELDRSRPPKDWVNWRPMRTCRPANKTKKRIGELLDIGPAIRTTRQILETLTFGERGDRNHSIPTCGPLELPDADLPIHPYILGYWLGDGDSAGSVITTADSEVVEIFADLGVECRDLGSEGSGLARRYTVGTATPNRCPNTGRMLANGSLRSALVALGVVKNKHVPGIYMRASVKQRLALLRGLMDSDGCAEPAKSEFCSTKEVLARQVYELAVSLGQRPSFYQDRAKLAGRDCGARFRVVWTPTINPFSIARKRDRVLLDGKAQSHRLHHRMITSVKRIDPVPMSCITVDSPNSMYLAGEAMIPTHNTRMGAEWVRGLVEAATEPIRINLIGPTASDTRDVMVRGDSGIINISPPWLKAEYSPSNRRVTWANGSIATLYSAEEPERLRGPQAHYQWCDELCSWKQAEDVWNMAQMGLRLGRDPRTVITTTPKPTALLKKILVDKKTKIVRGSTYENKDNLAGTFIHSVIRQYEGTDLGRQELHAEVLSENKNALWNRQTLARCRVGNDRQLRIEDMAQVVVAVDPPASSSEKSDECGLVVCGLTHTRMGVVLADRSGVMSPKKWAQAALQAAKDFHADRIVAERNNGGEMVKHTLRSYHEGGLDGSKVPVKTVFASRGKWTRAEPIASLFQQERCLLNGIFPQLEDQLCEFDPLEGDKSPDRFDAMVWGLTDLMLRSGTRFFI